MNCLICQWWQPCGSFRHHWLNLNGSEFRPFRSLPLHSTFERQHPLTGRLILAMKTILDFGIPLYTKRMFNRIPNSWHLSSTLQTQLPSTLDQHSTSVVVHLSFLQNIQVELWFYVSTERGMLIIPILSSWFLYWNKTIARINWFIIKYVSPKNLRWRGWREAFCIFFKAGHWRVLWHWQRSDSPCVHNSQGISPTCFKCSLSLYLLIQALDEIVAWSIDTHIMGMSLYPTQESTPDHIDTN